MSYPVPVILLENHASTQRFELYAEFFRDVLSQLDNSAGIPAEQINQSIELEDQLTTPLESRTWGLKKKKKVFSKGNHKSSIIPLVIRFLSRLNGIPFQ